MVKDASESNLMVLALAKHWPLPRSKEDGSQASRRPSLPGAGKLGLQEGLLEVSTQELLETAPAVEVWNFHIEAKEAELHQRYVLRRVVSSSQTTMVQGRA